MPRRFVEFAHGCKQRGMRLLIGLVVNPHFEPAFLVQRCAARPEIEISRLVCPVKAALIIVQGFFCEELPERIDSEYDDFERESSDPALVDSRRMALRVGLMTREYPPNVYGGAGVHVEYLSRELAKRIDVEVHCWGDQFLDEGNLHVRGAHPWSQITQGTQEKYKTALETLSLNLAQMNPLATIDIVHTHTWYVA